MDPEALLGQSLVLLRAVLDGKSSEKGGSFVKAKVAVELSAHVGVGQSPQMLREPLAERVASLADVGSVAEGTVEDVDAAGGGTGEVVDHWVEIVACGEATPLVGVRARAAT